jgi:hypothetical protein
VGFKGGLIVLALLSTDEQPAEGLHVSTGDRLGRFPVPEVPNSMSVTCPAYYLMHSRLTLAFTVCF